MIEKIQVTRSDNDLATKTLEAINKINELIDVVNELQTKVNKLASNINFVQPEVKDKFAEQRKWIGKVCRFFDSDKDDARIGVLSAIQNGMYFIKHTSTAYDYCEPVKPNDDVIYKGE